MKEEKMENMSIRLHALEVNMIRLEEKIKRSKFRVSENKNNFFEIANEGMFTEKLYSNDIRFEDIDEDANGNESMVIQSQFSKIKNIGTTRTILTSPPTPSFYTCGLFTPSCLKTMKQNYLYNILWVVVSILSFIASCYYINNAYNNWQSSPVVQAVSNNQVSFENISFPAVTLCWPNTFNKNYDFFNNIEKCLDCVNRTCSLKNNTCDDTEMTTLWFAYDICSKHAYAHRLPADMYKYVPTMIEGYEFNKYMEMMLPECWSDEVMMKMGFGLNSEAKVTRCNGNVFQQFYSSQNNRVCMTFNSLRHKDIYKDNVVTSIPLSRALSTPPSKENTVWSFDNMMEFKGNLGTIPIYGLYRVAIVIYNRKQRYESICNILDNNIVSILTHGPDEIPIEDGGNEHFIGENVSIVILIAPKTTLAREDLSQYPPQQRNCLFAHEKNLTMFKSYTKNNCDLECLIDAYLRSCGCVPHMYPRQNNSVKVCVHSCIRPKFYCDCLSDCNSLSYDISVMEAPMKNFVLFNNTMQALIELRLKGNKYYTNIRYSITSHAEFLAYSLGVLGAFLGFSVTCVWKLLYLGIISCYTYIKNLWNKAIYPFPQH